MKMMEVFKMIMLMDLMTLIMIRTIQVSKRTMRQMVMCLSLLCNVMPYYSLLSLYQDI